MRGTLTLLLATALIGGCSMGQNEADGSAPGLYTPGQVNQPNGAGTIGGVPDQGRPGGSIGGTNTGGSGANGNGGGGVGANPNAR